MKLEPFTNHLHHLEYRLGNKGLLYSAAMIPDIFNVTNIKYDDGTIKVTFLFICIRSVQTARFGTILEKYTR